MDPKQMPEHLDREARQGLRRTLPPVAEPSDSSRVDLGSNDYLGLRRHPAVIEAAQRALVEHGTGSGASPLLRGRSAVHEELESALATLKRGQAALLFSSGYAANLGLLSALGDPEDVIYCDRLDHASIVDGARLARARVHFYRHGDVDHLERQLRRRREGPANGHVWIVTDGVFSMDGILAPLPALHALAAAQGATLVVDDAHATGILGHHGAGTLSHFGLSTEGVIQMGTLSKALGAQGGYVVADRPVIDWLVQRARSFIYSTGLSPVAAAAAHAALGVVEREPQWNRRLQERLETLRGGLAARGATVLGKAPAPMLAVQVGEAEDALRWSMELATRGIIAPAVRPPTVPHGTSRIRLAPKATASEEEIARVLDAFESLL